MEQSSLLKIKQRIELTMTREYLQRSTYLLYRINQDLEIPLDCLLKENSLMDVSHDVKQFTQALKLCNNCIYDESKQVVIPQIKPMKNQLIVNDFENREQMNNYLLPFVQQKNGFISFDEQNNFRLIFKTEEDTQQVYESLKQNNNNFKIKIEEENLYINLLETSKLSSSQYLNNNYFQMLQMQYMMQLMSQQNSVYNKNFYVRKNSEQVKDKLNFDPVAMQQNLQFINRKLSCNLDAYSLQQPLQKFSIDDTQQKQRLRLSSKNFPLLPQKDVKQEKITQFYLNREIIKIYNEIKGQIKPANSLQEHLKMPVIETNIEKQIEHLQPTYVPVRKDSTPFVTPKQKPLKK